MGSKQPFCQGGGPSTPHPQIAWIVERFEPQLSRAAPPGDLDSEIAAGDPVGRDAALGADIAKRQRASDAMAIGAGSGGPDQLARAIDRLLMVHQRSAIADVLEPDRDQALGQNP